MVTPPSTSLRTIHVVGAAIFRGERCLAARRAATTSNALLWEFPGGKVEHSESPEEALARELAEELGLHNVVVGDLLARGQARVGDVVVVLDVYRVAAAGHPTLVEHSEFGWFDRAGLAALTWAEADLPAVRAVLELIDEGATIA